MLALRLKDRERLALDDYAEIWLIEGTLHITISRPGIHHLTIYDGRRIVSRSSNGPAAYQFANSAAAQTLITLTGIASQIVINRAGRTNYRVAVEAPDDITIRRTKPGQGAGGYGCS